MRICLNCNKENDNDGTYCVFCGMELFDYTDQTETKNDILNGYGHGCDKVLDDFVKDINYKIDNYNIELKEKEEKINYEFPSIELIDEENEIKEVIQSKNFLESKSKMLVGLKENSEIKIIDIQETSHILIAGTTGIGKTNLLDNTIINILYKSNPNETKLVIFDTCNNGLTQYNGIPHLVIPVITNSRKAVGALAWIVQEIENRKALFLNEKTQDFNEFNRKMVSNNKKKLPTILIIIDEISEIVKNDKENVEDSILKITKQGKKTGVFLIISTNRPSTDIISGTIKANIYTRISFFLPARLDSKLILDMDGAEKLQNHGDLLLKTFGISVPQKYHCPYISNEGINSIVNFVKKDGEGKYDSEIIKALDRANKKDKEVLFNDDEPDPRLEEAIEEVITNGQASTSFIQRRLKVGDARAGRIIDQMQERGIISGYQGSKPREVLMTKERWNELKRNNK